jgi:hypothetical protein
VPRGRPVTVLPRGRLRLTWGQAAPGLRRTTSSVVTGVARQESRCLESSAPGRYGPPLGVVMTMPAGVPDPRRASAPPAYTGCAAGHAWRLGSLGGKPSRLVTTLELRPRCGPHLIRSIVHVCYPWPIDVCISVAARTSLPEQRAGLRGGAVRPVPKAPRRPPAGRSHAIPVLEPRSGDIDDARRTLQTPAGLRADRGTGVTPRRRVSGRRGAGFQEYPALLNSCFGD